MQQPKQPAVDPAVNTGYRQQAVMRQPNTATQHPPKKRLSKKLIAILASVLSVLIAAGVVIGVVAANMILDSLVQFPDEYGHVPIWASEHHELLSGRGYPDHLQGRQIPKEVRLLTILDIFEALTAKDRPYKKPMTVERALSILESMVSNGDLDGDILALFKGSRAWEKLGADL